MESLLIEAGKDTPEITFDLEKNFYQIKGKSYPEDALGFYEPVFRWLKEYIKGPKDNSNFIINVRYLNSISNKMILDVMRILSECEQKDKIKISWCFKEGNEDMKEQGEEFAELVDVPVEFVQID